MDELQEVKRWSYTGESCFLWRMADGQHRACVVRGSKGVACAELSTDFTADTAARALEAVVDTIRKPRGAWFVDKEPVADLVVVAVPNNKRADEVFRPTTPIALAEGLFVTAIDVETGRLLFDACDPETQHRGQSLAIDLRMPMYALVRNNPPRDPLFAWDTDHFLQQVVALSRLVRPTSMNFQHALRQVGYVDGRHRFAPAHMLEVGVLAYTAYPDRDWLDGQDFRDLARLIAAFKADPPARGSRAQRAMWLLEYCARTRYVDTRWPLAASAVEVLLVTNTSESTRQFTRRIALASERLGQPPISSADASRMWGLRSKSAHGATLGDLSDDDLRLYRRMEDVARGLVRLAIEDGQFRNQLQSDDSVDAAFPIPPKEPKKTRCPECGVIFSI